MPTESPDDEQDGPIRLSLSLSADKCKRIRDA
jgi:hypothetical protein